MSSPPPETDLAALSFEDALPQPAGAESGAYLLGEERDLVLAARRGEGAAAREIYDRCRDRVWAFLLYAIGDPLQAQDVLQSVFLKAFRGLDGFRFQSSLSTWLLRIAHNECRNHRRQNGVPLLPLEAIIGGRDEIDIHRGEAGPEEGWERRLVVRRALMRLPLKWREVVALRYLEGLSYSEMSRVLGCAPGTVASRLNRALAKLEEWLRPYRRLL